MSDPISTSGQPSFALYVTPSAIELVQAVVRLAGIAQRRKLMTVATGALRLAREIVADLNETSAKFLVLADATIILKIDESHTASRPRQGELQTHIHSTAGPLGTVHVALIEELEKIINPAGYGTFWRAQEFGTGKSGSYLEGDVDVPSQTGRMLYGTFEDSGTPPDASQQGRNVGRDVAFMPGGDNPGLGTISEELPGRHFLRDGSLAIGEEYVAAIAALQEKYASEVAELQRMLEAEVASDSKVIGRLNA
jgi:hypothetical protein